MVCIDGGARIILPPSVNVTVRFHAASARPLALQDKTVSELTASFRRRTKLLLLVEACVVETDARACAREIASRNSGDFARTFTSGVRHALCVRHARTEPSLTVTLTHSWALTCHL